MEEQKFEEMSWAPSGAHSEHGGKPWPHPYLESLDLSFSGLYFRFSIYRGKADIL